MSIAHLGSLAVIEQAVYHFTPTIARIDALSERDKSIMVKAAMQFHAKLFSGNIHVTWAEFTNDERHARILSRIGDVLIGVVTH